jgi:hypothetical protein
MHAQSGDVTGVSAPNAGAKFLELPLDVPQVEPGNRGRQGDLIAAPIDTMAL